MPRTRNRNKNYEIGRRNRQRGIFKKSFTYFDFYQEDIAVIIKGKNGQGYAWESSNGFIKAHVPSLIHSLSHISSSDDFLTISHRQQQQSAPAHDIPSEDYSTWPDYSAPCGSSYGNSNETASPAWTAETRSTDPNESPQTQLNLGCLVDRAAAAQQMADYQALFETPVTTFDPALFESNLSLLSGNLFPTRLEY
ncbi:hypothetical protein B0T21DRAFT_390838 [Apiosordaria backusii]|uniref:MADS-box domain-containing protein n=1 Tax=Apiosordaria backusii TaxID=314023 RepID=A0AA40EME2_9PEZI|nr:hypothetical protein B0T21DRAFT_390838 [Apiosordaria backusii]